MNARAIFLFGFSLVLVGCGGLASRTDPAVGGPVVFVDAAGNRMVVDTSSRARAKPSPEAPEKTAPVATATGKALSFAGEDYVDAGDLQQQMDSREKERFFVVPDGSGARQTLTADQMGVGDAAANAAALPALPVLALSACDTAVRLPLLAGDRRRHHELEFPAIHRQHRYAGYLVTPPGNALGVTLWTWVQKGRRASPLLAIVDADGAVTAIVNNFPTESIPESMFRYGRVGGSMSLGAALPIGGHVAVLDGAMATTLLPAGCLPAAAGAADDQAGGLVTLEFSGSTGN